MNPQDQQELIPNMQPSVARCRPFLKWAGGKHQLLDELKARKPFSFNTYHEPFAGGAALFFDLLPRPAVLSDANQELINTYLVLRDNVEALIDDLRRHVYEKEYYYHLRDADRSDSFRSWTVVQRASRFIYLNKTCFNGLYRVNRKGQFNAPFGKYSNPTILDEVNLRSCSHALQQADISCESFQAVEDRAQQDDFVYFDPPTLSSGPLSSLLFKQPDPFKPSDHYKLRITWDKLTEKGVKMMITMPYSDLSLDLYSDMNPKVVFTNRKINKRTEKRQDFAEMIATNYPHP